MNNLGADLIQLAQKQLTHWLLMLLSVFGGVLNLPFLTHVPTL